MCATYICCGAERHLGTQSMGVLKQANLSACREELLARYAGSVQTIYLDPPFYTGKQFEMTEQQKTILIESVSNALANPYQMTQSVN